jgi:hypothetical protein
MSHEVKTDTLDPLDPSVLVDLIASVYRNARPAQKEAGA